MRRVLALLICVACKVEPGTIECEDGFTCPSGTSCLAEPIDGVHCVSLLCGNGVIDPGEACDGDVETGCVDLGLPFDGGRPACTNRCTLDLATCELFGFRSLYEGTERIGRFCAYERTGGDVVAHFFRGTTLVELAAGTATDLATLDVPPRDLACLPGKIAAVTRDAVATYASGAWKLDDVRFSDGTVPHWQAISATGDELTAVGWASLISGGYGGIVVAGDGAGWNIEQENTSIMTAVSARGGTRIAADEHGALFRRSATGAWPVLSGLSPFMSTLGALCVVAIDDVLGASAGQLMRWQPNAWFGQPASPGAIAATSQGTVFVAGNDGVLGHRDRYGWDRASGLGLLDAMWVASNGALYASRASELLRADALWLELPTRATTIESTMVAGRPTLVQHRSGVLALNAMTSTIDGSFVRVSTFNGVAFAAGATPTVGTAARLDLANPLTWPAATPLMTMRPNAVVAVSRDLAFAAGTDGRIVKYDGTWGAPFVAVPGATLHAITRAPTGELIVVGSGGAIATSMDGATWTRADAGITETLRAVHVRGDEVYVVGDRGTIARRSGGAWSTMTSPTTRDLFAIHSAGDRIIAAGDRAIVQLDGTRWVSLRVPVPGTIFSTIFVEPPYVYAGSASQSFVLYRP